MTIRKATPDEANLLNELFYRSKAHWGYDEAFMERVRHLIYIIPKQIAQSWVYVHEDEAARVVGFYMLLRGDDETTFHLEYLFIEPQDIGRGYGKALFQHAVALVRTLGGTAVTLAADAHAEAFYLKLGCIRIGDQESVLPYRTLPLLRYSLPAD